MNRLDDCQVVDHLRGVRENFADSCAVVAVLSELEHRRSNWETFLARSHRRNALAVADGIRQVFVEPVLHLRFVIPHVELGRSSGHEQVDHSLRFGREVRNARDSVVRRSGAGRRFGKKFRIHDRRQSRRTNASCRASKEMTPCFNESCFTKWIHRLITLSPRCPLCGEEFLFPEPQRAASFFVGVSFLVCHRLCQCRIASKRRIPKTLAKPGAHMIFLEC